MSAADAWLRQQTNPFLKAAQRSAVEADVQRRVWRFESDPAQVDEWIRRDAQDADRRSRARERIFSTRTEEPVPEHVPGTPMTYAQLRAEVDRIRSEQDRDHD